MADPLDIQEDTAFSAILKWLGRPGYAVRNVLSGNFAGAGRQAADFVLDPIDAWLPGDLIPAVSQKQDYVEASDLVGGMDPGWGKFAVDFAGGVLTDPLTYTGLGLVKSVGLAPAKIAAQAARSAAPSIPGGVKALKAVDDKIAAGGMKLRELIGDERIAAPYKELIRSSEALGAASTAAQKASLEDILRPLASAEDRAIAHKVMQNIADDRAAGGVARPLVDEGVTAAQLTATDRVMDVLSSPTPGQKVLAKDIFTPVQVDDELVKRVSGIDVANQGLLPNTNIGRGKMEMVTPVDPNRFASGVDLANAALGLGKAKALKPDAVVAKPTVKSIHETPAQVLADNKSIEDVVTIVRDPTSKMLGAVDVTQPRRSGALVAPVTDTVSMQSGGVVPTLSRAGADELPDAAARFTKITDQQQALRDRLSALGVTGAQAERIAKALNPYVEQTAGSFRELVEKGVFSKPKGEDLKLWSPMYAQRQYLTAEDELLDLARQSGRKGAAQASKARTVGFTGKELAEYLNKNPDAMLDEDFAKVAFSRAGQQGEMLKRASIARGVVDDFAKKADEKMMRAEREVENWTGMQLQADKYAAAGLTKAEQLAYEAKGSSLFAAGGSSTPLAKAMPEALKELAKTDIETARALERAFYGLEPRGAFMESLAKLNSLFKPYATAGAFIPRISFNVRNVIQGGGFQVLMNPKARQVWPQYAKEVAPTLMRSIDDGIERLTGVRVGDNEFKMVNDALASSGGRVDDALAKIPDQTMREALQQGVITDGFSSAELLADQLARTGWSKRWRDMRDWPAEITQGAEKRMRFATFKALRGKGMSAEEAAQIVEDTFFKYRPNSELNRAARDVIPFFQFTAKATPQVLRTLVNAKGFGHPGTYMRVGAQQLYGQGNEALLPPMLQGSPVVPIGKDEEGNPQYLTSTGLPFEVLDMIPNVSDDPSTMFKQVRQNLVGALNPTIKTGLSATFGVDPFFGSNFGSWDRAPYAAQALGADERSEGARIYNILAGTGLIQPLSSPVQTISQALDPRKSGLEAAATSLTGVRVSSVDETRALQQLVEEKLKSDPSIQRYEALFAYSPDPEQQALLDELKRVKAEIRARKKAEAP